jgi:soluble P-type ATPase
MAKLTLELHESEAVDILIAIADSMGVLEKNAERINDPEFDASVGNDLNRLAALKEKVRDAIRAINWED